MPTFKAFELLAEEAGARVDVVEFAGAAEHNNTQSAESAAKPHTLILHDFINNSL